MSFRLEEAITFYLETLANKDLNEYIEAVKDLAADGDIRFSDYRDTVEEVIADKLDDGELEYEEICQIIDLYDDSVDGATENTVYNKLKVAEVFERLKQTLGDRPEISLACGELMNVIEDIQM